MVLKPQIGVSSCTQCMYRIREAGSLRKALFKYGGIHFLGRRMRSDSQRDRRNKIISGITKSRMLSLPISLLRKNWEKLDIVVLKHKFFLGSAGDLPTEYKQNKI